MSDEFAYYIFLGGLIAFFALIISFGIALQNP
jgi:hypothetical protein